MRLGSVGVSCEPAAPVLRIAPERVEVKLQEEIALWNVAQFGADLAQRKPTYSRGLLGAWLSRYSTQRLTAWPAKLPPRITRRGSGSEIAWPAERSSDKPEPFALLAVVLL